jgi:Ca2+-transporting ATPase
VLGALALALLWLGMETERAVTVSFVTLALAKLWHVFNMREQDSSLLDNEVTRNPFVWGALAICLVLILLAVYLPGLADILKVVNPGWSGWVLAVTISLTPLVIGQALKAAGITKI